MRALWLSLCVTLIIAFVEAQRNINIPQPTVSLEKRPRLPTWRRPPEERKKLSIFPKNNKKFVVTERTTLKNKATTPAIATKRPLMKKLFVKEKTVKDTVIYPLRKPLLEPKRFNVLTASTPKRNNISNFKAKNVEATAEESTIKTVVTSPTSETSANTLKLNRGNLIQILNSIDKATVTPAKINEQPDIVLNKHETEVVQNNNALKVNSSDKVIEESVSEKSANNKEKNLTVTKVEEQVDQTTENVFLSKQEDKVIQNSASPNANTRDEGSVDYEYEEIDYDNSEAKVTATNINKQVSTSTEKVFLSKKINIADQTNGSLTINLLDNISDKSVTSEADSNVSVAIPAQIRDKEEIESTTHVFNEEPVRFNEPFESRSLDTNGIEIHEQNDQLSLDLKNKYKSEKTGDSSKLNGLEILMKAIAKDTWSDNNNELSLSSNIGKPSAVQLQDVNAKTVKSQPQEFDERPDSYYEVKQVINMENETKMSTGNNVDATVIEITAKNETENIETKANYTNTDQHKNNINIDVINNLEDLNEVTIVKFTSTDIKEPTENSQHLDSNIIEEYTNKSDSISSVYEKTTLGPDLHGSLTEFPIELTFDNVERSSLEEISNEPSTIKPVIMVKSSNDRLGEDFPEIEDVNTNTFSEIVNSNIERNANDEKGAVIEYLHNLAEIIKDKSTVDGDSEVSVDNKSLVNLDLNIVEEYSDKPDINTTEVEGSIQESYFNAILITESPIEIIFDSQEALVTEKNSFEPTFNINMEQIIDNSITDQLNVTNDVISTTDDPVMEDSQKVEDENINIICAIENLCNEQNMKENNASGAIENDLSNLDVVINFESNDHDKSVIIIDGIQFLNEHVNIVDEDTVKPDTVTMVIDGTISTNEAYIEGGNVFDTPIEMLFFDHELLNTNKTSTRTKTNTMDLVSNSEVAVDGAELLNHHMNFAEDDSNKHDTVTVVVDEPLDSQKTYDEHITDAPMPILFNDTEPPSTNESEMEQLDLTKDVSSEVEAAVIEVIQKVEDVSTNTIVENLVVEQNNIDKINSPSIDDIINNNSNISDNNIVTTNGPQLVNLHINIAEENSGKPKTITIVFDGTTQKTYLNGEHIDDVPMGILFDNLEPLGANELLPGRSLNEETNESVTEQSSSSDVVISNEATIDKSTLKDEDISGEWLFINSSPSNEITDDEPIILEADNIIGEGYSNDSNTFDIASESIIDNSINVSDESLIELSEIGSFSTLKNEEISEAVIAEADQSKNLTNEILNESHVLNESSTSVLTNEDASDKKITHKSENFTDEISTESHVLNESSISIITNEKISNEEMTEKSEKFTDEISNKPHVLNESSTSIITNEKISNEEMTEKSENFTDEISNEPHVLNESSTSIITNEKISNEEMTEKSEKFTDEISTESDVLNESSTRLLTNEDVSDEKVIDKSENFTDEISNEPHVLNESSTSIITNEKISNEEMTEKSEIFTDEILNEPHVLNESSTSIITNEKISNEEMTEKSEKITDGISTESHVLNESSTSLLTNEDVSDEKVLEKSEDFTDEISNEPHVLNESSTSIITNEKISNEEMTNKSENFTDEISNEPHVLNESSTSIITNEKISNEEMTKKSENFNDEISNEPHVLNESSTSVMTNEEISDEKMADRSEKFTDEISNESHVLNESSTSVMTNEEISDEKITDRSENFTDEISNESHVLNESSTIVITNEDVSDEKITDKSENFTDEISNESHIENESCSSSITNEDASNEMTGDKSENLTGEISDESLVTVTETSSTDLTAEGLLPVSEQPNNETTEDVSTEPAIDIRHPSPELASNEILVKRRKRSNNVIEEENLATTLSGFKYTGHETRLGHDLRFKNINA